MKLLAAALASAAVIGSVDAAPAVNPRTLPKVGTVSERFQGYNVEMIEVTGGAFWKPYGAPNVAPQGPTPAGMDPKIYAYRKPKDLSNPRLRMLAAALGPTYVRVSGTWANATYFADTDTPPAGFNGLLTRSQWKGVIDFAHAVNAKIVTSFALSTGTRDTNGVWTPDTARPWLAYTRSIGGEIAAAEFANEPSLPSLMSVPKGYDAAAWGRDFKLWRAFLKEASPATLVLGPGSVGDTGSENPPGNLMRATDMLTASGRGVDAFSYHHYGDVSQRCHGGQTLDMALSEGWLARTGQSRAVYAAIRDRFEPGKPLWLTEVGDAACGGNPWAKTFADSFRYLDQLGRLAKGGVQAVMHNTLAISDYGLIDEVSLLPRPNYWSALLWRRLMGTTVLDAGVPTRQGLHVYAHCQYDMPGGVALLVINNDPKKASTLALSAPAQRYSLSAAKIDAPDMRLNGQVLALTRDGKLPTFKPAPVRAGTVSFAPATITFLTVNAKNKVCGI
jgi:heparanase